MGDLEWVSVSEAARRLGVSRTAIHNRINRGTLSRMTDNHGRPLIQVPVTVSVAKCHAMSPDTVTPTPAQAPPPEPRQASASAPDMVPLAVHRETVQAVQAAYGDQIERLRTDLESERQRHVSEIERLVGLVHAERQFWVERADAAEVRAEAAEQRVAEARRPWWTRLLGASKKTDLGE